MTLRIVTAAVVVAAIGGLIGFLIAHFVVHKGVTQGVAWGIIIVGGLVGFLGGGTGCPERNWYRGRWWGTPSRLSTFWSSGGAPRRPKSPLPIVLGGLLAFGAGVALLILTY